MARQLASKTEAFYRKVLRALDEAQVAYLVGGAYALEHHTGIVRDTKDLDVFVGPADCQRSLALLGAAGYRTELTFPHWLGKVRSGDAVVDVIYSSGNGVAEVDAGWFEHAEAGEVLGRAVRMSPVEEMIWSKAFIMERERYDGADIAHLLHACADRLDWRRLLHRFGPRWRVLLSHVVLFGFVYPAERARIPSWAMRDLMGRLEAESGDTCPPDRVCQGTLLSRAEYLVDVDHWGYRDARLSPSGSLTAVEVAYWTAAIDSGGDAHADSGNR